MKKLYPLMMVLITTISAYGQSPLDARVSLNVNNLPLKEALYDLIDQGAQLSFNNSIIPGNKTISLYVNNERIGKVLPLLFKDTDLSVEVIGNQIVIVKKPVYIPPPPVQRYSISGFIIDAESGEHIINATIYDPKRKVGTYTNEYGHYTLMLPEGEAQLLVSSLGYQGDTISLKLQSNLRNEVKLSPLVMAEVVVASFNDSSLLETKFGGVEVNLEQAERLPSLGGETDILRVGYTLPGIQTGADGFGGISVRGGDIDQNLFLLDGVPIYNASHGLGLYSIYNSSAVRIAKILKGSIPAQYGGRISSIWDIQTKEGNMHHREGELEIGIGSLMLTLEGPLNKGKGSWFVSGRRSLFDLYTDEITRRLKAPEGLTRNLNYIFQDVNAKVNYRVSPNDRLFLSVYRGNDYFLDNTRQEFLNDNDSTITVFVKEKKVRWGNNLASLRWNHVISDKIFANITAIFSNYYYIGEDLVDLEVLNNVESLSRNVLFEKYQSSTTDLGIKSDFDYTSLEKHRIRFGASLIQHRFQPGIVGFDNLSILNENTRDTIGSYLKNKLISKELDAYIQDEINLDNGFSANIGLRATALYVNDRPLKALQPRLLLTLNDKDWVSYNFSVTRNAQFLHLLSPTNIGLPKDLWVSATQAAPPQTVWQFSLGTQLKPRTWLNLDLEAYYKWFDNLIYFQGGKLETINATNWQDEIAKGKGWAYGAEALLKIERGKFGGWISYTYSHADRQFDTDGNILVNNGKRFPIRLDRRHNFNFQGVLKLSKSWDFSVGYNIAAGSAYTFPSKIYEIRQSDGVIVRTIIVVTDLNNYRMPKYERIDFSFNYQFTIRNIKHQLKLGAYNTSIRKNPAYYTLRDRFDDNGALVDEGIAVSLLPFFPTLRYIMKFN